MGSTTHSGKVKFFNETKGWGFISESGANSDLFVHVSNTLDKIVAGDEVLFNIENGKRGPKAVDVRRKK